MDDAGAAFSGGDIDLACNDVKAFINEVKAQSGKKIQVVATADDLIAQAAQLRAMIGCQ